MYTENALLFPEDAIPLLEDKRGWQWQQLVQRVEDLPAQHEERLAFMLLMMRMNGCMDCETDCYRAMRGCHACSLQTLRRYKGSDDDLLAGFENALTDVREYAQVDPRKRLCRERPPFQHALPLALSSQASPAPGDIALASIT